MELGHAQANVSDGRGCRPCRSVIVAPILLPRCRRPAPARAAPDQLHRACENHRGDAAAEARPPVIAILAFNAATEVTDLLGPFNVLTRAEIADVFIVAERAYGATLPVQSFGRGPMLLPMDPQMTISAFDRRWPEARTTSSSRRSIHGTRRP